MYIEKLMMIILFTHKLVVAAAHWPDNFKNGFLNPCKTFLGTPCSTKINTVTLLPIYQMFINSMWMCRVAVFCIFLCKVMWFTAHGYYSAGAGHSVALKQFSPYSCIQGLMRKKPYLLTKTCYTKHIYTTLMLHTERKGLNIWTANFSMICLSTGCMMVLEHYCSCDGLLQWNLSWREPL